MWTQKSTLALIKDIRLNPCLWNLQCEDYKNRTKRVNAYKALGAKYGINGKEIEQKFHALKNQFRREHRRLEKQEEGLSPKQIHWFGYEPLLFLLNNCVKPSQDKFMTEQDLEDSQCKQELLKLEVETPEYEEYEVLESETMSPKQSQPVSFTPVKKKNKETGVATATEAFKCMRTLAEKICSRDEFDIYGEYIAYKLRESGRSNKEISIAQHEINTICFKLCMGEFAQNIEHSLAGSVHSNPETEEVELRYVQYADGDLQVDPS
ncbi:uncharacterized protein LOC125241813 [Leguminivora glycinivorella]|uniref:uncharacterized protein LOC125241813 n=1 Tax=Leguminivora glycinivorella TaxID=1035111 RepID=UPI00200D4FEE|nr:uncharacterized protein LOC125241813 [Leguminivora glycinivorella]